LVASAVLICDEKSVAATSNAMFCVTVPPPASIAYLTLSSRPVP
jgi:hypothetical protein